MVLERGEAIGLLVILAVILVGTVYVGVRRTASFALVLAPVELVLGGWVASAARWEDPGAATAPRRTPRGGSPPGGGGGSRVREPRRPRPSSGAGTATRHR
jgi:hypothetical protein